MAALKISELRVDALQPGRYQPRHDLREESIAELAESIRGHGILQPLIVRALPEPSSGPAYEIVAGERRWRAAHLAGLTTVPAIIRELDDRSTLAVALIENLQREDLNAIDQARSMQRLVDEFGLTHEEIAQSLGRSRASVTNFLRLLDLADDVKTKMQNGAIEMGHARALLPLSAERQVAMAQRIERLGWSVRQVERSVKALLEMPTGGDPKAAVDLQTRWLETQLARELGEKISIRPGAQGEYVLKISFPHLAKLETTLRRLHELVCLIRETAGPREREKAQS